MENEIKLTNRERYWLAQNLDYTPKPWNYTAYLVGISFSLGFIVGVLTMLAIIPT